MEDQPAPNEEEKKMAKIQDLMKILNRVVEISIQNFLLQIERVEKNFKEGYRGEAFLVLTSVLELQMNHLWQYFLLNSTGQYKTFEELLELKTFTEILWHVGYISSSQRNDLKDFQKGRNTVAHYASKHFQKGHPSDKILEERFKKGLKISNGLIDILKEKSPKYTIEFK